MINFKPVEIDGFKKKVKTKNNRPTGISGAV